MDYTIIEVPDMNDSVSRVVLSGTAYLIRFTYNDARTTGSSVCMIPRTYRLSWA